MPKYNNRDYKSSYFTTAEHDIHYGFQCEQCGRDRYKVNSYYKAPKFIQINYKCPSCRHEKDVWYSRKEVEKYLDAN